jgi:dynein heavy chain 1
MFLDYPSFERALFLAAAVFNTWDDSVKEFTNVARDVTRKRNEKFLPIKINSVHAKLQERVTYLRGFRKLHHQLGVMVGPLANETRRLGEGGSEIDMDAEVVQAYESVKNVDVLEVSTGIILFYIVNESIADELR